MTRIRPFRPGDEAALADVCLRTADAGVDATGVLDDDELWAEIFVLPYVARHPESAFVVEAAERTAQERVVGYAVAVPDTAAFETWFRDTWWPERGARWPKPTAERSRQDGILLYAYRRGPGKEPYGAVYPAHLHIDLLPELQGQGWGRRLIDTVVAHLRERGVGGLHLVADAGNAGALAFYDRLGFERLASHAGVQAFGLSLT